MFQFLAKSKQKNKDAPKQTQVPSQTVSTNHKQNTPLPVPQTQPSKPTNKTNKMRELNIKGANKEGTDMDAFSDTHSIETVVVTNTNTMNDAPNINDITNINDTNKITENIEIATIKPENKTLPKKIDITDIVKEIPKPFVAPMETCDETDRMEYDNDKMVQSKNEVNSKANAENDSNMELRSNLPYKDGK